MAAYGLYTHIQSNKRRSIALLVGLFFLVYLLVYAGALLGEAFTIDAPPDELLRRAFYDALYAAPWATLGTALWTLIAYKFHQSMIDAVTGGREVPGPQGRRGAGDTHRHRAHRGRLDAVDRHPLLAVAQTRISGRRWLGRAHQESGRDDFGAAQDRGSRRASRRDLRGDGDVHRQSARGI